MHSEYSVWLDGKLRLLIEPRTLIKRFLQTPRASLALARNLKRNHIDEEMRWIRKVLARVDEGEAVGKGDAVGKGEAVGKGAAKISRAELAAVEMQWRFYRHEQRRLEQHERRLEHQTPFSRFLNATARDGALAGDDDAEDTRDDAPWMRQTACAEGAMIVSHLRSNLTRCVLCAWFNEWHRFGERDQLSLSYVLYAMGLTPPVHAMGLTPPARGADEGVTATVHAMDEGVTATVHAMDEGVTATLEHEGVTATLEHEGVTATLEQPQHPLPQHPLPQPQQPQHPLPQPQQPQHPLPQPLQLQHPLPQQQQQQQQQQHRGVYLWPRQEHWHYKRPKGVPKSARAPPYVKYTGHGGCAEEAAALTTPGCGAPKEAKWATSTSNNVND